MSEIASRDGSTVSELRRSMRPAVITDESARSQGFDSKEKYLEAIHEFLNSNWDYGSSRSLSRLVSFMYSNVHTTNTVPLHTVDEMSLDVWSWFEEQAATYSHEAWLAYQDEEHTEPLVLWTLGVAAVYPDSRGYIPPPTPHLVSLLALTSHQRQLCICLLVSTVLLTKGSGQLS